MCELVQEGWQAKRKSAYERLRKKSGVGQRPGAYWMKDSGMEGDGKTGRS